MRTSANLLPLEGGGDSPQASGWGWSSRAKALPVETTPTRRASRVEPPPASGRGVLALALLLATTSLAAAPARVASLNLCSDELALALAAPGQLVSVSRLGADARETPLAGRAAGLHRNRGRVTDVIGLAPDLVLASGGDPAAAATARRLGIRAVELPQPQTIADIEANIRTVATALGRQPQGSALIAAMRRDLGPLPAASTPALLVAGGGFVAGNDGLSARLLRHAGLAEQATPRGRVSIEGLLLRPPRVLVISRYHPGEASANAAWLDHPALRRLPAYVRRLETDGRRWTCLGPGIAPEIARLRAALAE